MKSLFESLFYSIIIENGLVPQLSRSPTMDSFFAKEEDVMVSYNLSYFAYRSRDGDMFLKGLETGGPLLNSDGEIIRVKRSTLLAEEIEIKKGREYFQFTERKGQYLHYSHKYFDLSEPEKFFSRDYYISSDEVELFLWNALKVAGLKEPLNVI